MNRVGEEAAGSIAIPENAEGPKRENDGFVRIGVDVVFHLDVLKLLLPVGDASGGAAGANAKKQMPLELDGWW